MADSGYSTYLGSPPKSPIDGQATPMPSGFPISQFSLSFYSFSWFLKKKLDRVLICSREAYSSLKWLVSVSIILGIHLKCENTNTTRLNNREDKRARCRIAEQFNQNQRENRQEYLKK